MKNTEQVPQGSRGHQGPDLSLHDHSFCNHCSPSFLQLLSDDAFSLFHSLHQPHYAPFVLCSDFPKENADFYPSEAIAFSCSLYLKTSHLSPVLFHFVQLKLSCKDTYSTQTALVRCCTSALGESSWSSHLPLGKAIYEQFYAGQMWNEYSILLPNSTASGMWWILFCFVPHLDYVREGVLTWLRKAFLPFSSHLFRQ